MPFSPLSFLQKLEKKHVANLTPSFLEPARSKQTKTTENIVQNKPDLLLGSTHILSLCRHFDSLFGSYQRSGKCRYIHPTSRQLFMHTSKALFARFNVTCSQICKAKSHSLLVNFDCKITTFDNTTGCTSGNHLPLQFAVFLIAGLPPPLQRFQTVSPLCTSAKCPPKAPVDDGFKTLTSLSDKIAEWKTIPTSATFSPLIVWSGEAWSEGDDPCST